MKSLFTIVTITTAFIVLAECSAGDLNHSIYHDSNDLAQGSVIHKPKLDTESVAEIGQNLYSKTFLLSDGTQDVILNAVAKGSSWGVGIDSTKSCPIISLGVPLYKMLYPSALQNKLYKINGTINAMCYSSLMCLVDLNNAGIFTHFSAKGDVAYAELDAPVPYTLKKSEPKFVKDSFQYEALYQGKVGNNIKISFREFKNDLARPAFSQDIEYTLDKDGKAYIGFKGLRIEVLKVTNFDITYKVIKDYN